MVPRAAALGIGPKLPRRTNGGQGAKKFLDILFANESEIMRWIASRVLGDWPIEWRSRQESSNIARFAGGNAAQIDQRVDVNGRFADTTILSIYGPALHDVIRLKGNRDCGANP